MNYLKITKADISNGIGNRVTLWVAGCPHHCIGCHNPESHDFLAGRPFDERAEQKLFEELEKPYIKGLTLTGGDPIASWPELLKTVKRVKERFGDTKDIWLWTGYTMEQLNRKLIDLTDIDYIVDGKFEIERRDISLPWRGSANQRIFKNVHDPDDVFGVFEDVTNKF